MGMELEAAESGFGEEGGGGTRERGADPAAAVLHGSPPAPAARRRGRASTAGRWRVEGGRAERGAAELEATLPSP